MKKTFLGAFLFAGLFGLPSSALADVIPPGTKPVACCSKIVNSDSFPGIVFIASIMGPMIGQEAYSVRQNECLLIGYKYNSFSVRWAPKSHVDSMGIAGHLSDPAFRSCPISDLHYFGSIYLDSASPVVSITESFRIQETSAGGFSGYLSKRVTSYSDGTPDSIQAFASPMRVALMARLARAAGAVLGMGPGTVFCKVPATGSASIDIADSKGRTIYAVTFQVRAGAPAILPCRRLPDGLYSIRIRVGRFTLERAALMAR